MPTPIGNLEDITLRALLTLGQADVIAAEDIRVTRRLLDHFSIHTEIVRYTSNPTSSGDLLARLARGQTVALVCDAGTPAIADPGTELIRAALDQNTRVVSLPGAVAAIVALTASGISPQRFAFDGFPPRGRADRAAFFESLAAETRTIVLYESAVYLRSTLDSLSAVLGAERQVAIARDLTGPRETIWSGALSEACRAVRRDRPRGQYTLVLAGLPYPQ